MSLLSNKKKTALASVLFFSSIAIANTALAQASSKGYIDGVASDNVTGWACTEGYAESVDVHVYIGGYAGNYGALLASGVANLSSDALVETECDSGYYFHRFQVSLAGIKRFGGQSIWVHGINTHGGISIPILNSGTYTVPNPSGLPSTPTGFDIDIDVSVPLSLESRALTWNTVAGASYYRVSQLRGDTGVHYESLVTGTSLNITRPYGYPERYMVAACSGTSVTTCGKYSAPIYAN